jgi:hypothetical protein
MLSLSITVHLNIAFLSTALRLHEPPLIDNELLTNFQRETHAVSGTFQRPCVLETFARAHDALERWSKYIMYNVPPSFYRYSPINVSGDLIYGVTMLTRWARIMCPIVKMSIRCMPAPMLRAHPGITDPPPRPGGAVAGEPELPFGMQMMSLGVISGGNGDERSAVSTLNSGMASGRGRSSHSNQASSRQQVMEQAIPAIVQEIKRCLASRPELKLDVGGILSTIAGKFKATAEELRAACQHEDEPEPSVWDLSYRKVIITKMKLEKWIAVVSQDKCRPGLPLASDHEGGAAETDKNAAAAASCISPPPPRPVRDVNRREVQLSEAPANADPSQLGGPSPFLGSSSPPSVWEPVPDAGSYNTASVGAEYAVASRGSEASTASDPDCCPPIFQSWQYPNPNSAWSADAWAGVDPALWAEGNMDWTQC